jgi:predicted kinase
VLEKDALKEALYDALGVGDVEWSRRLGTATYALIFSVAAAVLRSGGSLVAEANFFRGTHEERFAALPPHRLLQVHCHAPLEVVLARYEARAGTRHPGHLDADRIPELRARYAGDLNGPLDLPGALLLLDTASADVPELAERVLAQLSSRT